MTKHIFVDSNIFVFANIADCPEHDRALKILEKGLMGGYTICFNDIIALETHYKLLKILGSKEARYRVSTIFDSKRTSFLKMDVKTIKKAFELCEKYNILTNDAGIIASMLENYIDTIYTDNVKDFRKIDKIRVVNPVR